MILSAVVISIATLTLYVAPFISMATALIAHSKAPPWVMTGVTALLSAIATAVTMAIHGNSDLIVKWETLGRIGMAFAAAEVGYLVLRNTPVLAAINSKVPGGVGAPKVP